MHGRIESGNLGLSGTSLVIVRRGIVAGTDSSPLNPVLGRWALYMVGLSLQHPYVYHHDMTDWSWEAIGDQTTIWTPSPKIAQQSIMHMLEY
jgi:hypothetical protein